MIIISDCNKDIVIPAGLGDNAGVVYETAGVKSLNGETGDLKIKTVNGNEMLGDGNIEIKGGVETVNGETGDVKIKTVNGQSLMGEGDVPVDVGVESLNGQTGNLKIKSVNGNDMLGEGNVAIDTGVESLNGQKGALTLKTVNGNELTGDGNIEIKVGSDDVIVLDGLTQEERKAVYDKLDKSVPPKEIFKYGGAVSFYTYWGGGNYLKIFFLDENYGGGRIKQWSLDPEGSFGEEGIGMNYPNFLFLNVGDHAAEGADFECGYTGDYNEFMYRPYTEPNGYFLVLKKGIGDSTKKMVLPLTVLWDKEYDGSENIPIRIQFAANEKLYTYLHGDEDGKWLFESAKPITGVESLNGQKGALTLKTVNGNELTGDGNIEIKAGVESVNGETGNVIVKSLKYKQVSNANRKEVYDDVKAHWSNESGYTGNYVYYYQKDNIDQIIFDEVKFEGDRVWFNSATLYYTSGQVHNPRMRLLCCFFNSEEEIRINENDRVVSDVNGMRYRCGGVINDGDSISFTTNIYGNGFDIYNSTETGMHDGLFDAQFDSGIGGYKGNTPANIFTDGTDVFMAFDVVDNHYVYKKVDNSWVFVSRTKIGGVQSSEVSNIKVLTQSEYDALTTKDENVLYCIKG